MAQGYISQVRQWLSTFPDFGELAESGWHVDYTDAAPVNAGIYPGGIVEVSNTADILGNRRITNQLNAVVYRMVELAPGDDTQALANSEILERLTLWVQDQSAQKLLPAIGDIPEFNSATASNGEMYSASIEGYAIYSIQISITFYRLIPSKWGLV